MDTSPTQNDWRRFIADPLQLAHATVTELYALTPAQVNEIQLTVLQRRFAELAPKIPVVKKLAQDQKVGRIDSIDDVTPLLLSHTVYKSYPLALLEKARFDLLTKWLSGLTPYDLSKVDASKVTTIDDWLDLIDRETPLRCLTTSGTTGKMSFVPRSSAEWDLCVRGYFVTYHQGFRNEHLADLRFEDLPTVPFVFFNYRYGKHTQQRIISRLVEAVYGGNEDMCFPLYPGTISMDVMSIAGRLRAAGEKGLSATVKISDELKARRDAFAAQQQDMPRRAKEFIQRVTEKLRGQRIMFMGPWYTLFDAAMEAQKIGQSHVFAANSLITTGGGFKGRVLPDDWYEQIVQFLGVPTVHDGYGCSELIIPCQQCPNAHYHCSPAAIPFLMDPDTGAVLPRQGTQTGRFAFMDLLAHTYWGGFVTGDEVTITWDEPCGCGRTGPYLHKKIQRFSEKRGGDDKINCAGMPEAHQEALEFLTNV